MELWFYVAGLSLMIVGVCTLSFWLVIAGVICFLIPATHFN